MADPIQTEETETPLIAAAGLGKTFDARDGPILSDLSLALWPGQTLAITGSSGSGKTTLLSILGGLLPPDAGALSYRTPQGDVRHDLTDAMRAQMIGFVFQDAHLIPTLNAAENIEIPMIGRNIPRARREARARELLDQVGLAKLAGRLPSQLSGGERQRVGLARAFALRPPLIVADEPTGNLDRATAETVADVLLDIAEAHQVALLVMTHDLDLAARMDLRMELHDGRLWEREAATPHPVS